MYRRLLAVAASIATVMDRGLQGRLPVKLHPLALTEPGGIHV